MKKTYNLVILCMILILSLSAQNQNGYRAISTSDRQTQPDKQIKAAVPVQQEIQTARYSEVNSFTISERRELLENKHKSFFNLPYSEEHIRNEIMLSIRNERKTYAPHFPDRTHDIQTDHYNLTQWLTNYPDELISYMQYLDSRYLSFKNAVNN